MASTLPPLEGDGVVDSLFHYLALENEAGSTCPGVRVPETVVYKYRSPAYCLAKSPANSGLPSPAFHTEGAETHVEQRAKWEVKNNRIEEIFSEQRKPKCEILASYISVSGGGEGKLVIEYFDRQGLHDFLFFRSKVNNGILQKFLPPRGKSNFTIRVVWTPIITIVEQCTNKAVLSNTRLDMYERAVTFEGPDHLRETTKLRGERVQREIGEICLNVVDHVQRTTHGRQRIARMVLNLRIDEEDRIWLLYCSSVRLEGARLDVRRPLLPQMHQPLDMQPGVPAPRAAKHKKEAPGQERLFRQHYFECPACRSVSDIAPDSQHEVTYREYLHHHDAEERRRAAAEAGGAGGAAGLGASASAASLSRPASAATTRRRPRSAALVPAAEPPREPAVVASYLQPTAAQQSRVRAIGEQLAAIDAAAAPPRPGTARAGSARAGSARLARTRTAPPPSSPPPRAGAGPGGGAAGGGALLILVAAGAVLAPPSLAAAAAAAGRTGRPGRRARAPPPSSSAAPPRPGPAPRPAPGPEPAPRRPRTRPAGGGAERRPASALSRLRSPMAGAARPAAGAGPGAAGPGAGRLALADDTLAELMEAASGVPPLIAAMHPQLTRPEFLRLRDRREWQERTALVCDACYTRITSVVMEEMTAEVVADGAKYAGLVLQSMRPERERRPDPYSPFPGAGGGGGAPFISDPAVLQGLLDGEYTPA
eukprot:tig00001574_g9350.t1